MFCRSCGAELADDAKFCTSCGASTAEEEIVAKEPASPTAAQRSFSAKAIAGFVLSLVGIIIAALPCGILGIIFSALALREIPVKQQRDNGLAIEGLIVSIVDLVFWLITIIINGAVIARFL